MSNFIQDLLRDPPPVMILDMGLGSREQSLPTLDSSTVAIHRRDSAALCADALPINPGDPPATQIQAAVPLFPEAR